MAKDARTRTRARRLCEWDGISDETIEEILSVSRRTLSEWKKQAAEAGDPWVKGKFSQELREKEDAAKVKAIEAKGWDRGRVLAELGILAGSNINDYVDVREDGSVRLKDITRLGDVTRAIKTIEGKSTIRKEKGKGLLEDATFKLVLHDKRAALVDIGRELGMFKTEAEKIAEAGIFSYYRERAAEKRKAKA